MVFTRFFPRWLFVAAVPLFVLVLTLSAFGGTKDDLSTGAMVYVSVYSNIYYGPRVRPFPLAATLSIRNTDPQFPITVESADYYDSDGRKIRDFMEAPQVLKPLASTYFYVEEKDTRGGSGANFIVRWSAKNGVNRPIIETVMTGVESGQGISFVCPGKEIMEHRD
jgi:hypothetical protein